MTGKTVDLLKQKKDALQSTEIVKLFRVPTWGYRCRMQGGEAARSKDAQQTNKTESPCLLRLLEYDPSFFSPLSSSEPAWSLTTT